MKRIIEWIEPDEVGNAVRCRCTFEEAALAARKANNLFEYDNDEDAVSDFMAIHWAYFVQEVDHEDHTFTTPDDWDLVEEKVVIVPYFPHYLWYYYKTQVAKGQHEQNAVDFLSWWIMCSYEMKCKLALDWALTRPDLFPWVVEYLPIDGLVMEEDNYD